MTNQEAIDIIRRAIVQVEWDYPMEIAAALDKAVEALKKEIPRKWEYDRPVHWRCPACGTMMGQNIYYHKYCYICGQKCEGVDKENDAEGGTA